jgi:hypothetical protein
MIFNEKTIHTEPPINGIMKLHCAFFTTTQKEWLFNHTHWSSVHQYIHVEHALSRNKFERDAQAVCWYMENAGLKREEEKCHVFKTKM